MFDLYLYFINFITFWRRRKWQTHSNILAWEILWTEESCQLQSVRLQRVEHNMVNKPKSLVLESLSVYFLFIIEYLLTFSILFEVKTWTVIGSNYLLLLNKNGITLNVVFCKFLKTVFLRLMNILHIAVCVCSVCAQSQLCLTVCDPMNYSPSGSSVHGIIQERILECVAISSSRGSSWPRDETCIS